MSDTPFIPASRAIAFPFPKVLASPVDPRRQAWDAEDFEAWAGSFCIKGWRLAAGYSWLSQSGENYEKPRYYHKALLVRSGHWRELRDSVKSPIPLEIGEGAARKIFLSAVQYEDFTFLTWREVFPASKPNKEEIRRLRLTTNGEPAEGSREN